MEKTLQRKAEEYIQQNHRMRIRRRIVRAIACVAVFCVPCALIRPAITLENTGCGLPEHRHSESCYEREAAAFSRTLVCTYESLGVHSHTADCYDCDNRLLCGQADFLIHAHSYGCFDSEGELVCQLPEISPHEHTDVCYRIPETEPEPEESTHTHTEDCYSVQPGALTCPLTETEGHSHSASCFAPGELLCQLPEDETHTHGPECHASLLICQLPEEAAHLHNDGCYETVTVLVCQQEEGEATSELSGASESAAELICAEPAAQTHIHSDGCFALTAPLTCAIGECHTHGAECYDASGAPVCPIPENHTHSSLCYGIWHLICPEQEHSHDLYCLNNPEADEETEAEWKASFAHVTLSGNWSADVLAIARSQLGYAESARNYLVLDDGETTKGYTRYGDWYGYSYGDWCAMFSSFCLHYAGVENMPMDCNCQNWIRMLEEEELYHPAEGYTPAGSDLIFFDWNGDGISDHVGIVAAVIPAAEGESPEVKVIEGNCRNRVAERTYPLGADLIMGYGQLPAKPPVYFCGLREHIHSAFCMYEIGKPGCSMEAHIHRAGCLVEPERFRGEADHSPGHSGLTDLFEPHSFGRAAAGPCGGRR